MPYFYGGNYSRYLPKAKKLKVDKKWLLFLGKILVVLIMAGITAFCVLNIILPFIFTEQ